MVEDAGTALRELWHAQVWRRVGGGMAFALYIGALGAWTLLLGHYRRELIENPMSASDNDVTDLVLYGSAPARTAAVSSP